MKTATPYNFPVFPVFPAHSGVILLLDGFLRSRATYWSAPYPRKYSTMTGDAIVFVIVMPAIVLAIGLIAAFLNDRAADKEERKRASRTD